MNKILKYHILPDMMDIEMPKDAQVLTIQCQNDIPVIWALVNPDNEKEKKHFELFGTGHDVPTRQGQKGRTIPIKRKYINTFQMKDGLVFHLFERIN